MDETQDPLQGYLEGQSRLTALEVEFKSATDITRPVYAEAINNAKEKLEQTKAALGQLALDSAQQLEQLRTLRDEGLVSGAVYQVAEDKVKTIKEIIGEIKVARESELESRPVEKKAKSSRAKAVQAKQAQKPETGEEAPSKVVKVVLDFENSQVRIGRKRISAVSTPLRKGSAEYAE